MSRTGFYPGSFDPVTNGHIDIITRCANLVDDLVLGVGVHHGKSGFLSPNERILLLQQVCEPVSQKTGLKIRVEAFDNLAVKAAQACGASVIIRGLRDASDFDYEVQMGQMNAQMAPKIETVFLAASPSTRMIASSLVKQIAKMGGDISSFVPPAALTLINKTLQSN